MNLNNEDKLDCAESIIRALERTASWRKTIAPRFDDSRNLNLKAAETLEKLAVDAAVLTDGHWTALQPHYAWSSAIWRDALFNSTRQVGFAHGSKNLDAFIRLVLRQLNPVSIAA
jgi:cyclopropane fatty-acyl-phospholipid synthase-like methyltransferase